METEELTRLVDEIYKVSDESFPSEKKIFTYLNGQNCENRNALFHK